ncbi:hypothetical protein NEHOM01_1301 [Nematocida homosporus]|uniref:uncharacterized protein n=1 Tax=Nematocida homosporus TaxID=1912981 RepID=UPI002220DCEC|nr:uncharacterized protein NEHOM01_1301 [Nematocida homosporus]KAI5186136.1 hypothetical protein NEHOM01_1301 [Nematocida homosporus]
MVRNETDEITLIGSGGTGISVPYRIICECEILKKLVDESAFLESLHSSVHLPIAQKTLIRVVEYLWYKSKYHQKEGEVEDFIVGEDETLDLLEASAFLQI